MSIAYIVSDDQKNKAEKEEAKKIKDLKRQLDQSYQRLRKIKQKNKDQSGVHLHQRDDLDPKICEQIQHHYTKYLNPHRQKVPYEGVSSLGDTIRVAVPEDTNEDLEDTEETNGQSTRVYPIDSTELVKYNKQMRVTSNNLYMNADFIKDRRNYEDLFYKARYELNALKHIEVVRDKLKMNPKKKTEKKPVVYYRPAVLPEIGGRHSSIMSSIGANEDQLTTLKRIVEEESKQKIEFDQTVQDRFNSMLYNKTSVQKVKRKLSLAGDQNDEDVYTFKIKDCFVNQGLATIRKIYNGFDDDRISLKEDALKKVVKYLPKSNSKRSLSTMPGTLKRDVSNQSLSLVEARGLAKNYSKQFLGKSPSNSSLLGNSTEKPRDLYPSHAQTTEEDYSKSLNDQNMILPYIYDQKIAKTLKSKEDVDIDRQYFEHSPPSQSSPI